MTAPNDGVRRVWGRHGDKHGTTWYRGYAEKLR